MSEHKSKSSMLEHKSDSETNMHNLKSDLEPNPEPGLEVHLKKEPESASESTLDHELSSNINPETKSKLEPETSFNRVLLT